MTEEKPQNLATQNWFSQANVTTALSVAAFVLAAAPYVIPQVSAFQVKQGLRPQVFETAISRYDDYQKTKAAEERKLNSQKAEMYLAQNKSALRFEATDPAIGNRNAPIKVYAFIDYNCSACRAVDPHVIEVIKKNPDAVLVIKEFPVITEISPLIAAYALAAHEMGVYEKAHYAFYKGRIRSEDDILKTLSDAGLDAKSIQKRAYSPAIRERIRANIALGEQLQLTGTPAYIVGNSLIPGGDVKAINILIASQRSQNKT